MMIYLINAAKGMKPNDFRTIVRTILDIAHFVKGICKSMPKKEKTKDDNKKGRTSKEQKQNTGKY